MTGREPIAFGYIALRRSEGDAADHDHLLVFVLDQRSTATEVYSEREIVPVGQLWPGFTRLLDTLKRHATDPRLVPVPEDLPLAAGIEAGIVEALAELSGRSGEASRWTCIRRSEIDSNLHPLAQLRASRGWSYQRIARIIADRARRQGINMAAQRQKVWRWEHRRVTPDQLSQRLLL